MGVYEQPLPVELCQGRVALVGDPQVIAGAVRYPLWRFAVYVTLGKVIKVTTIALAGYYGINRILEIVG